MGLDNPLHLAFLAMLLLLVFGAKRLPEIGRSLGSGMRGFRESISGETSSSPSGSALSTVEPAAPAPAAQSVANGAPAEPIAAQENGAAVPAAGQRPYPTSGERRARPRAALTGALTGPRSEREDSARKRESSEHEERAGRQMSS
jgi:sec-independent protein translocase protein TatA